MLVRMWTEGLCTAEQIHILSGRVLTSICYLEGNRVQSLCVQRWCVGEDQCAACRHHSLVCGQLLS